MIRSALIPLVPPPPLACRSEDELRLFNRVVLLRRVEQLELGSSREANNGVWSGLLQEFPSNTDWLRAWPSLPLSVSVSSACSLLGVILLSPSSFPSACSELWPAAAHPDPW